MRSHKRTRRQMLLLLALSITSVSLIPSCSSNVDLPVDIHNAEFTILKGSPLQGATFPQYAVQEYFLTDGQTDMDKDATDLYLDSLYLSGDPALIMPLSAWTAFDDEIAKLCSNTPCNYDATQALHAITAKMKAAVQPL